MEDIKTARGGWDGLKINAVPPSLCTRVSTNGRRDHMN